jgi:hypothetical protein
MKILNILFAVLLMNWTICEDSIPDTFDSQASQPFNFLKKASPDDLKSSYDQMMQLESSPEEKKNMDKMMEKLSGITASDQDSMLKSDPEVPEKTQSDLSSVENLSDQSVDLQKSSSPTQDRKLDMDLTEGDSFAGKETIDDTPDPTLMESSQLPDLDMGGSSGGSALAGMKDEYDKMSGAMPGNEGLGMSVGADSSFDDSLNSGIHQQNTQAMIDRMDEANKENMAKVTQVLDNANSSFDNPKKVVHKKKKAHRESISQMLKGYPPELVHEFMPVLKEKMKKKMMHLQKEKEEKRRIRKLKEKIKREKRREHRRKKRERMRKLREKRRREWRKHHHHHHPHHQKIHLNHRLIMKKKRQRELHSLSVIKHFIHRHLRTFPHSRFLKDIEEDNRNIQSRILENEPENTTEVENSTTQTISDDDVIADMSGQIDKVLEDEQTEKSVSSSHVNDLVENDGNQETNQDLLVDPLTHVEDEDHDDHIQSEESVDSNEVHDHFENFLHDDEIELDETHVEDTHVEDTQVDDTHVDDTHVEDTHVDDTHVDDTHVDDTHVDDTHVEDTHVDDTQVEDTHVEDTHVDDIHEDDVQEVDTHVDDIHEDETHVEDPHVDDIHEDEIHIDDTHVDDIHEDEIQEIDSHLNESHSNNMNNSFMNVNSENNHDTLSTAVTSANNLINHSNESEFKPTADYNQIKRESVQSDDEDAISDFEELEKINDLDEDHDTVLPSVEEDDTNSLSHDEVQEVHDEIELIKNQDTSAFNNDGELQSVLNNISEKLHNTSPAQDSEQSYNDEEHHYTQDIPSSSNHAMIHVNVQHNIQHHFTNINMSSVPGPQFVQMPVIQQQPAILAQPQTQANPISTQPGPIINIHNATNSGVGSADGMTSSVVSSQDQPNSLVNINPAANTHNYGQIVYPSGNNQMLVASDNNGVQDNSANFGEDEGLRSHSGENNLDASHDIHFQNHDLQRHEVYQPVSQETKPFVDQSLSAVVDNPTDINTSDDTNALETVDTNELVDMTHEDPLEITEDNKKRKIILLI